MPAKKSIFLYCADSELLSATAFALRLHGYQVLAVNRVSQALTKTADSAIGCGVVIHAHRGDLSGKLIYRVFGGASYLSLLLVDRVGDLAPVPYADMVLYGSNTSMAHILSALHILSGRGRRPQPGGTA